MKSVKEFTKTNSLSRLSVTLRNWQLLWHFLIFDLRYTLVSWLPSPWLGGKFNFLTVLNPPPRPEYAREELLQEEVAAKWIKAVAAVWNSPYLRASLVSLRCFPARELEGGGFN